VTIVGFVTRADVVIVGAGLAGLAAALRLTTAGVAVDLREAGDAPGGRVRTDVRDGFRLDRGFQLLNPAYPEVHRVVDLDALDLRPFGAGVTVHRDGRRYLLADPRRMPTQLLSTVRAPLPGIRAKVAAIRWALACGAAPARWIRRTPDEPLAQALRERGVVGEPAEIIGLFLSGVLAEAELTTSRRFAEFLVRSFIRGTPALPANGMQALPDQLAVRLPNDVLRLDSPVRDLTEVDARAVVVATDPVTAADLLARPAPTMKALTTYYHRAPRPPTPSPTLHIDLDAGGSIRNTAVVSTVAPTYASEGSALVASTVLGAHDAHLEQHVRIQAGRIYGADTDDWELVAAYAIPHALPAVAPGQPLQRRVDLGNGMFVAGDHRDTASIQGALVSGRRAADAVLASLGTRPARTPTAPR
jgi:hypothetical protein